MVAAAGVSPATAASAVVGAAAVVSAAVVVVVVCIFSQSSDNSMYVYEGMLCFRLSHSHPSAASFLERSIALRMGLTRMTIEEERIPNDLNACVPSLPHVYSHHHLDDRQVQVRYTFL